MITHCGAFIGANVNTYANVNANSANYSVPIRTGANVNAIKLAKGFDIPSQIQSKKRHLPYALAFKYHMLHVNNVSLRKFQVCGTKRRKTLTMTFRSLCWRQRLWFSFVLDRYMEPFCANVSRAFHFRYKQGNAFVYTFGLRATFFVC